MARFYYRLHHNIMVWGVKGGGGVSCNVVEFD